MRKHLLTEEKSTELNSYIKYKNYMQVSIILRKQRFFKQIYIEECFVLMWIEKIIPILVQRERLLIYPSSELVDFYSVWIWKDTNLHTILPWIKWPKFKPQTKVFKFSNLEFKNMISNNKDLAIWIRKTSSFAKVKLYISSTLRIMGSCY